jgi:2-dehydro-3-deoxyphosphooctonate aldolase (KDO 8-P synthase)
VRRSPLFVAGPCSLESRGTALLTAQFIDSVLSVQAGAEWVFKGSYTKDNRTSGSTYRGPGLEEGLGILAEVRSTFGVPVTTDVHEAAQVEAAAAVVDIIQIPAFLCRQTSLLEAAGSSGRIVNVKKGQFMSPSGMAGAVDKLRSRGCPEVWLTERGSFFGYGDLVVDFRSLRTMAELADRVLLDVTHSLQRPGAAGDRSGGDSSFAVPMARAAAAWGVDGLFLEVHPDPASALSDPDTMLGFDAAAVLIKQALGHWVGVE